MLARASRKALGATSAAGVRAMSSGSTEWFKGIDKIAFEGASSKNPLSFKHYNAEEVVMGKVSTGLVAPVGPG